MTTEIPAVLDIPEAALKLKRANWTVRSWARCGELPGAFKLRNRWLIPETTIALMLSSEE